MTSTVLFVYNTSSPFDSHFFSFLWKREKNRKRVSEIVNGPSQRELRLKQERNPSFEATTI